MWQENVSRYPFIILCFTYCIFLLFQLPSPIPKTESGPLYSFIPGEVDAIRLKTDVCQQQPFLAFVFWKSVFLRRIVLWWGGVFRETWLRGEGKQSDSFPRLGRGLEDYRSFVRWQLYSQILSQRDGWQELRKGHLHDTVKRVGPQTPKLSASAKSSGTNLGTEAVQLPAL